MKFNKQLLTVAAITTSIAAASNVQAMQADFTQTIPGSIKNVANSQDLKTRCQNIYFFLNENITDKDRNVKEKVQASMDAWIALITNTRKPIIKQNIPMLLKFTENIAVLFRTKLFDLPKSEKTEWRTNRVNNWKTEVQVELKKIETHVAKKKTAKKKKKRERKKHTVTLNADRTNHVQNLDEIDFNCENIFTDLPGDIVILQEESQEESKDKKVLPQNMQNDLLNSFGANDQGLEDFEVNQEEDEEDQIYFDDINEILELDDSNSTQDQSLEKVTYKSLYKQEYKEEKHEDSTETEKEAGEDNTTSSWMGRFSGIVTSAVMYPLQKASDFKKNYDQKRLDDQEEKARKHDQEKEALFKGHAIQTADLVKLIEGIFQWQANQLISNNAVEKELFTPNQLIDACKVSANRISDKETHKREYHVELINQLFTQGYTQANQTPNATSKIVGERLKALIDYMYAIESLASTDNEEFRAKGYLSLLKEFLKNLDTVKGQLTAQYGPKETRFVIVDTTSKLEKVD